MSNSLWSVLSSCGALDTNRSQSDVQDLDCQFEYTLLHQDVDTDLSVVFASAKTVWRPLAPGELEMELFGMVLMLRQLFTPEETFNLQLSELDYILTVASTLTASALDLGRCQICGAEFWEDLGLAI